MMVDLEVEAREADAPPDLDESSGGESPGSGSDLSSDEDSQGDSRSSLSDGYFGSSKCMSRAHDIHDILDESIHLEKSGIEPTEGAQAREKHVGFTVQGLYDKAYLTEQEDKEKKLGRDTVLLRKRINTYPLEAYAEDAEGEASDAEGEKYEEAWFDTEYGLSTGWFWHEYYGPGKRPVRDDRAVLFQSKENYQRLAANPLFKAHYDELDYMETPSFGEQIIVDSYDVHELAIGDIFKVQGGLSTLVIEISAPRHPCGALDTKHGTKGPSGMKTFAHHNLLGGVFAKILTAGDLCDGMTLTRTAHPHPQWTLHNIFRALYSTDTRRQYLMCAPSWNGSREELEEVINLPQLGEWEWKVEARKLLLQMDGIKWKTVKRRLIDPQSHPLHPMHARLQQFISDGSKFVITTQVQTLKKLQTWSWSQVVQMIVFFVLCIMSRFLY